MGDWRGGNRPSNPHSICLAFFGGYGTSNSALLPWCIRRYTTHTQIEFSHDARYWASPYINVNAWNGLTFDTFLSTDSEADLDSTLFGTERLIGIEELLLLDLVEGHSSSSSVWLTEEPTSSPFNSSDEDLRLLTNDFDSLSHPRFHNSVLISNNCSNSVIWSNSLYWKQKNTKNHHN